MATRPNQGAAQAAPAFDLSATVGQTVVRLPTASRRKVYNNANAVQCAAMMAARKAQPWPGEYQFPGRRDAMRRIRELRAMPPSPAVNLVRNLIDQIGTDDARSVLRILKVASKYGEPLAIEVEGLMEWVSGTSAIEVDNFTWAPSRLDGIDLYCGVD